MSTKSKILMVFTGLLLSVLASCSTVPLTGREQLNFIPDSQMNSLSLTEYKDYISSHQLSSDTAQTQMVKNVGARIQKAVETYCAQNNLSDRIAGYKWEFNLVVDSNVNAFAMPGGKVVVNTGIIPVAQNEEGLAVVMGHEISHVIARHGSERMSQGLLVEMGGVALSTAMSNNAAATSELFMKSYGVGTQYGILLPYSRAHETEADHLGLIFMAMAGYNPNAAVDFWQRMAAASKGSKPIEFLSTHPADQTRINNLKKFMPEAMKYYKK
jgi:predicted Zn-dependent protease